MDIFTSVLGWISTFALIWLMIIQYVPTNIWSILALIFFFAVAQTDLIEKEKRKNAN